MENLNRIKQIISVKQPRLLDFVKTFDKLRHGRVTQEQMFRCFEMCQIVLTDEERAFINEKFSKQVGLEKFIAYQELVQELNIPPKSNYQTTQSLNLKPTQEILEKLKVAVAAHPIIGKNFFLDFDIHLTGLISGQNFARGVSSIYEAVFRRFPSQPEIDALCEEFQINKLTQIKMETMPIKEMSSALKYNLATVDYRAFCDAIGASSAAVPEDAKLYKSNDPAFKQYFEKKDVTSDEAFVRIVAAYKKFRFDFKNFMIGRDKRGIGFLSDEEFIQAVSDCVSDFKRVGFSKEDLQLVMRKYQNKDGKIEYKIFVNDVIKQADTATQTIRRASYQERSQAVEILQQYFSDHPACLRSEFEAFDKRRTGKVTAQQFKQVLGQVIQIRPTGQSEDKRLMLQTQQLDELVKMYSIEATSGSDQVSPDKLCGSGYLIDYIMFIKDVNAESDDFIPTLDPITYQARVNELITPDPQEVYFIIADGLCKKHQKLSDCLYQGEVGSTKWNRSRQHLNARLLQRSLNLLQITLSDLQVAAICLDCPSQEKQLRNFVNLNRIGSQSQILGTLDEFQTALNDAEISSQELEAKVKVHTEQWQPDRVSGFSCFAGSATRKDFLIGGQAPERSDVTKLVLNAKNLPSLHVAQLLKTFGPTHIIKLKNEQTLQELVDEGTNDAVLELYYEIHINRANPVVSFAEFDKLKSGFITVDQFTRAFTLAGLKKVVDFYPASFKQLIEQFQHQQAGPYFGYVDYATLVRNITSPTLQSYQPSRTIDYKSVAMEQAKQNSDAEHKASLVGIHEQLKPICTNYRPKLRDYFLDFDKRRSGLCEFDKFGAAMAMIKTKLNDQQISTIKGKYLSEREGFQEKFEWRAFVEDLEKFVGMRL